MGKGKALDELTKQQVIYLWMNKNHTQMQIAKRLGIGTSTVKRVIGEYASTGAHEPPAHMEIPEAAPIAEKESADVEEKSVNAEEKSTITETDKMPHFIWVALDDQVSAINWEIEQREQRIAELKEELVQLEDKRYTIEQWMEEQKWQ